MGNLYKNYPWYRIHWSNNKPIVVIGKKGTYRDTLPFVMGEISYLFSEWLKVDYEVTLYKPKPKLSDNKALQHFLGLNEKEFAHLFIPNEQCVVYGGDQLHLHSQPPHVANNIMIFLRRELDKQENKIRKALKKYGREPNDNGHSKNIF
jgi:hypothetical protein